MRFESWSFTTDELVLKWESIGYFDKYAFKMNEYVLSGNVTFNEAVTPYNMTVPEKVPRNGKLDGLYSTLLVKFTLARHV